MKQKITQRIFRTLLGLCVVFVATPTAYGYLAAPFAVTDQPTFITEKSMRMNGRVNPSEMEDTMQWFEWGISGRSDVYETKHTSIRGGNKQIAVSANLIGLAPGTQYFYRQVAENGRGKSVGTTAYATTKPLVPTVNPIALIASHEPSAVGETSVTMRAYVSPHGNSSTKTWFEWGETSAIDKQTPRKTSSGNSGFIEAKIDNLMPGTLYYYRAVAENSQGRTYGLLKVAQTRGTPYQTGVTPEAPREQYVPAPVDPSADTVARNTTTSGTAAAYRPIQKTGANSWSWPSWGGRIAPSTKESGDNETSDEVVVVANNSTAKKGNENTTQIAGVAGALSPVDPSRMLSGKSPVEVALLKVGPEKVTPHTAVEYLVAYGYHRNVTGMNAKLKITLPPEVIYIGDNTNNQLLLETGGGANERTYVLPLGNIQNGSTSRLSILGMTTAEANGFPDARVRLEYTDADGFHSIPAKNIEVSTAQQIKENIASVGESKWKILPSSLLGWLTYVLVVVGLIIGVRKARDYYTKKREMLEHEESEITPPEDPPRFFQGEEMGTLQSA